MVQITLNDIDFELVDRTDDPKKLRHMVRLLDEDGGYYRELLSVARQKLDLVTGAKEERVNDEAEALEAFEELIKWEEQMRSANEGTLDGSKEGARNDSTRYAIWRAGENIPADVPVLEECQNNRLTEESSVNSKHSGAETEVKIINAEEEEDVSRGTNIKIEIVEEEEGVDGDRMDCGIKADASLNPEVRMSQETETCGMIGDKHHEETSSRIPLSIESDDE